MKIVFLALTLLASLILLIILTIIDIRERLLPNIYVFSFLLCGVLFHTLTHFTITSPLQMILGGGAGGGLLYAVRFCANSLYKQDTLGLGDVKLMAAAGIWLGLDHIFLALTLGAFLGLVHGFGLGLFERAKTGQMPKLQTLSLPAGPGFILGIVLTFLIKIYWT